MSQGLCDYKFLHNTRKNKKGDTCGNPIRSKNSNGKCWAHRIKEDIKEEVKEIIKEEVKEDIKEIKDIPEVKKVEFIQLQNS